MNLKSVDQLLVSGRRVFLRVDFNVPRGKSETIKHQARRVVEGEAQRALPVEGATRAPIIDDTRIREALPTIQYLLDQKAKVIIASHLGRPKGRDPQESLIDVAARLTELLHKEVTFPEDCIGDAVRKLAHDLREGDLLLLENLRFHKEEEANEPHFAEALAQLGEVYVTDAFGTLHREHASTAGIARHFKEKGIGFLVKKELDFLGKLLKEPERPFFVILGGAKISDKIGLIENLLTKIDGLLVGGGLAYTFLKAQGIPTAQSHVEEEKLYLAQRILQKGKEHEVPIYLPIDHRVGVAQKISPDVSSKVVTTLSGEEMGLDIGPETARKYVEILSRAKTIFWNGPLGVFESPPFAEGTMEIAKAVAAASQSNGALTVIGGGESLAAVKASGVSAKMSHLSTGGGAALEYLEGKELPGLKVLE
jgi:phosphoglycerate kinase